LELLRLRFSLYFELTFFGRQSLLAAVYKVADSATNSKQETKAFFGLFDSHYCRFPPLFNLALNHYFAFVVN
jgi:hypothetical protein